MLKMKLEYFGQLMRRRPSSHQAQGFPAPDAGKNWTQKEKGVAEDEMVR